MAVIPPQSRPRRPSCTSRPPGDLAVLLDHAEADGPGVPALRFQPIWNVRQKAVATYLCELATTGAGREPIDPAAAEDAAPALLGRLDRLVLRHALAAIGSATAGTMPGALCVPVHYRALADAEPRQRFIELCASITAEARALLMWELVGVPEGTLENSLFAIASTVRPHGRSLFMRCALDTNAFEIPAAIGIQSIGVDLRGAMESETRILRLLSRFAEQAHGVGLRCHAHGLATSSLGLAAIAMGFDHVSGPAISDSTEIPWGVLPYDAESLFLHNFV